VTGPWRTRPGPSPGGPRTAELALVEGAPGIVVAPHGRLLIILRMLVEGGRITEINMIADLTQLEQITVTLGTPRGTLELS
jgi:RNA polymerase sigma-70 factor (ECF subfamily)